MISRLFLKAALERRTQKQTGFPAPPGGGGGGDGMEVTMQYLRKGKVMNAADPTPKGIRRARDVSWTAYSSTSNVAAIVSELSEGGRA